MDKNDVWGVTTASGSEACMYGIIYVRTYVRRYVRMFVCMYVYVCISRYACVLARIRVRMNIQIQARIVVRRRSSSRTCERKKRWVQDHESTIWSNQMVPVSSLQY